MSRSTFTLFPVSRYSQSYKGEFTHVHSPGGLRRIFFLQQNIHALCVEKLSVREVGAMSKDNSKYNSTGITLGIWGITSLTFHGLLMLLRTKYAHQYDSDKVSWLPRATYQRF